MAAPAIDITAPAAANAWDDDLDQIRDNIVILMIMAAGQGYLLPNWTTTVNGTDKSEPDSIEMTQASLKMKWVFTWSSGNVTAIVWQYDKGLGAGYETLTCGTLTLSYDGSNNFTGATSA